MAKKLVVKKSADELLKEAYIKFRSNPLNVKLTDQWFCSTQFISLATLKNLRIKYPDIDAILDNVEITPGELDNKALKVARAALDNMIRNGITINSAEAFINSYVNLRKLVALVSGKPTERIELVEEELKKLTPQERNRMVFASLRRASN